MFAAEHTDGARAIKILHRELAERPEQVELFEAEAALAGRLDHPNLIRATDSGRIDGRHYIAMELCDGTSLGQRLAAGTVDRIDAVRIAIDLCAALEAMHAAGYAHCDVSPSNILLRGDGRTSLTDFGVSGELGRPQRQVRGTFAYMSPEQAKGEPLDPASDVFAVGVVLWEMLSGTRLFRRSAQYLTIAAVVEEEAPAVGNEELAPIVARCLEKDPARRFGSARELRLALPRV